MLYSTCSLTQTYFDFVPSKIIGTFCWTRKHDTTKSLTLKVDGCSSKSLNQSINQSISRLNSQSVF